MTKASIFVGPDRTLVDTFEIDNLKLSDPDQTKVSELVWVGDLDNQNTENSIYINSYPSAPTHSRIQIGGDGRSGEGITITAPDEKRLAQLFINGTEISSATLQDKNLQHISTIVWDSDLIIRGANINTFPHSLVADEIRVVCDSGSGSEVYIGGELDVSNTNLNAINGILTVGGDGSPIVWGEINVGNPDKDSQEWSIVTIGSNTLFSGGQAVNGLLNVGSRVAPYLKECYDSSLFLLFYTTYYLWRNGSGDGIIGPDVHKSVPASFDGAGGLLVNGKNAAVLCGGSGYLDLSSVSTGGGVGIYNNLVFDGVTSPRIANEGEIGENVILVGGTPYCSKIADYLESAVLNLEAYMESIYKSFRRSGRFTTDVRVAAPDKLFIRRDESRRTPIQPARIQKRPIIAKVSLPTNDTEQPQLVTKLVWDSDMRTDRDIILDSELETPKSKIAFTLEDPYNVIFGIDPDTNKPCITVNSGSSISETKVFGPFVFEKNNKISTILWDVETLTPPGYHGITVKDSGTVSAGDVTVPCGNNPTRLGGTGLMTVGQSNEFGLPVINGTVHVGQDHPNKAGSGTVWIGGKTTSASIYDYGNLSEYNLLRIGGNLHSGKGILAVGGTALEGGKNGHGIISLGGYPTDVQMAIDPDYPYSLPTNRECTGSLSYMLVGGDGISSGTGFYSHAFGRYHSDGAAETGKQYITIKKPVVNYSDTLRTEKGVPDVDEEDLQNFDRHFGCVLQEGRVVVISPFSSIYSESWYNTPPSPDNTDKKMDPEPEPELEAFYEQVMSKLSYITKYMIEEDSEFRTFREARKNEL